MKRTLVYLLVMLTILSLGIPAVRAELDNSNGAGEKDTVETLISARNQYPGLIPQSKSGSNWNGWTRYPDGQSLSGPAAAVYNGKIFTMVRGTDNQIYFKIGTGPGWMNVGGATYSNPAMAEFNGNLYALVRGTDNAIISIDMTEPGEDGITSVAQHLPAVCSKRIMGVYMPQSGVPITGFILIP